MSSTLRLEPRLEFFQMSLRSFVRLLFNPPKHGTTTTESLDSFLKTVEDSVHVRGGHGPSIPVAGNSKIYKMIAKGHKNYTNSFKSKKHHS